MARSRSRSRSRSASRPRASGRRGRSPSPSPASGKAVPDVVKSDLGYASLNPIDDSVAQKQDFNVHDKSSIIPTLGVCALMFGCPIFIFYVWWCCDAFKCSLSGPPMAIASGKATLMELLDASFGAAYRSGKMFDVTGLYVYGGFVAVQALLQLTLPGKTAYGQITPGGNNWKYHINGFNAALVSMLIFYIATIHLNLFKASIFYDYWLSTLMYSNILAYTFVVFLYVKAFSFPSVGPAGSTDVNVSGSLLMDLYKGIELNPRLGDFDLKMFCVSRIGMLSWGFVNASAAFAQYNRDGHVCNALLLINFMQFFYIFDLLAREEWYLSTIDIMLDRGGFYIFWGVCCFMLVAYVMQSIWLLFNPVTLSTPWLVATAGLHIVGYVLFLDSNTQRTRFRADMKAANNDASKVRVGYLFGTLFNHKPTFVKAEWMATDGEKRTSYLLTSGYWGWARHFNYLTDLCMCFAWGMASGGFFTAAMPWFYFVYMIMLLTHRAIRDERRLRTKYGKDYITYCEHVPYNVIPGLF